MARRLKKSVGPYVCRFVCNANNKLLVIYYLSSFIMESRITIRISGERAYNLLQENAIFSKNNFSKILTGPSLLLFSIQIWRRCLINIL